MPAGPREEVFVCACRGVAATVPLQRSNNANRFSRRHVTGEGHLTASVPISYEAAPYGIRAFSRLSSAAGCGPRQRSRPSLAFGCCERLARGECDRRSSPRLGPTRRWSHGRASRGRQPGAYGVYPARRAVAQHTNSRVAFAALRGSNNYIFRQVARTPVPSAGH